MAAAQPLRTCDADGTHHFSHIKKLALSGKQYLHAVNAENEPTRDMRVSTAVHQIILGPRADKRVVVYEGDARRGKAWESFAAEHEGQEILTAPEWDDAERAARVIAQDPIVQMRLDGARCEVPLSWEENGLKFSTSGVDIIGNSTLGDLKGTNTAEPERWKRTAFRMFYHVQLVFYRRGAVANGIDVSKGLFVLGYEIKPPHEVVDLELTDGMIELGERTLSLWLEKLRVYRESNQWPGYAQAPVPWDVPTWLHDDDGDDEESEP